MQGLSPLNRSASARCPRPHCKTADEADSHLTAWRQDRLPSANSFPPRGRRLATLRLQPDLDHRRRTAMRGLHGATVRPHCRPQPLALPPETMMMVASDRSPARGERTNEITGAGRCNSDIGCCLRGLRDQPSAGNDGLRRELQLSAARPARPIRELSVANAVQKAKQC